MTPDSSASPAASHACAERGHAQVRRDFATAQTYIQQSLLQRMPLILLVISSRTSGKSSKDVSFWRKVQAVPWGSRLSQSIASESHWLLLNLMQILMPPCRAGLYVAFKDSARAITPQQAFVMYRGEVCLGSAPILYPGQTLHEMDNSAHGLVDLQQPEAVSREDPHCAHKSVDSRNLTYAN